jgi:hypothetical protein
MTSTITDSYVVCSPSGHYHDYAKLIGWVKSEQHAVIKFSQFTKWYNEARFLSSAAKIALILPPPSFVGDTYEIAKNIADELNATTTETKGQK